MKKIFFVKKTKLQQHRIYSSGVAYQKSKDLIKKPVPRMDTTVSVEHPQASLKRLCVSHMLSNDLCQAK